MLRLSACDHQRTARYYTIYRTFKQWSSDDFTTILRLFSIRLLCIYTYNYGYYATTIRRERLRLLLTSVSYRAKARKEMRREPPMVPRRLPCQGKTSCQACTWPSRSRSRCQEEQTPRQASTCQRSTPGWYYSRLCRSGIVGS